jgi:hypothetical protein
MQRTTSSHPEELQVPSLGVVAAYAALVIALMIINVAGDGLIAATLY